MIKVIQSCAGREGRFGNSLYQYCTSRALAERYGLEHQVDANWVGRKIFQIDDPPITSISRYFTDLDFIPSQSRLSDGRGYDSLYLWGYFQFQDAINLYSRTKVREWLKFQPQWLDTFQYLFYEKEIGPRVRFHLRRTDYVGHPSYCVVSEKSYEIAFRQYITEGEVEWMLWPDWIKDDGGSLPAMVNKYPDRFRDIRFLPDFIKMVASDHLFRANSSFSYWAGVLTEGKVYSPIVGDLVGEHDVPFVEGNWPAMASPKNFSYGAKLTDLHLKD